MNIKNLQNSSSLLIALMAVVWLNLFPLAVMGQEPDPTSFGDDIPTSTESDMVSMSPASLEISPIDIEEIAVIDAVPVDGNVEPVPAGDSCSEYLDNGGFEDYDSWSFSGNSDYNDNVDYLADGDWSGYISTYERGYNEGSYLSQQVTIPDSYSSITIKYDTMAFAGDYGDAVYIAIFDESFDNLLDYGSIPYNSLYEWVNWKATPEVWLGGKTINLLFYIAHDNDQYYSGVSFDNISMVICENSYPTATPYYAPTATPVPPTPTRYYPPTATPVPPTPTRYYPPTATPVPPTPTRYYPPTATPVPPTPTRYYPPTATPTRRPPTATPAPPTPTRYVPPTATPYAPPQTSLNLRVRTMEISQSIQNPNSTVPLIADRAAIARVFVDVQNASSVSGVTALLRAFRNGQELSGSPLEPFNAGKVIVAPQSPTRQNFNHSLNFQLPTNWIQAGQTRFQVEVNPGRAIAEATYDDNKSQNYDMNFQNVAPLDVVLIPIAYQRNGQGTVYRPERTASNSFGLGILQKVYPVSSVRPSIHPEYTFRGDLKSYTGWNTLLQEIASLRAREKPNAGRGATGMPKYYGLLHNEAISDNNIAGLAYRPGTSGIGLIDLDFVTPHEIGHNLGLQHVSCGNPVGVDPNYPHANGTIGHPGLDIMEKSVVSESAYFDLMSYCGPRWVSDYHYNKMFSVLSAALGQNSQRRSTAQEQSDGWLITGRIHPDESGELNSAEPIVSSANVQEPGFGSYQVTLINQFGDVEFAYSFDPMEIAREGDDEQPSDFSFIVPQISDLDRIELKQGGRVLATISAATTAPALQVLDTLGVTGNDDDLMTIGWSFGGITGRRAADEETKVNVYYSADQGETWKVLAVGVDRNEFDLRRSQLPASENGIIKLVAVDRTQVTASSLTIGQIDDKAPDIGIVLDRDTNYYTGDPIMLESVAMDMEDGTMLKENLVWSSPQMGQMGTGSTLLYTDFLNPGSYTIELTATDSAGNQSQDSVQITVQADGRRVYLPFMTR